MSAAAHGPERTGVLLVNSGTPTAATPAAVRAFLARFLADRRIVDLPRFLWLPILYGLVLPRRPQRVAQKYRLVWMESGAPLRVLTEELAAQLRAELARRPLPPLRVEVGMLYSPPELRDALERLRAAQLQRILVLPLFPQSCGATTGAVRDAVARLTRAWPAPPQLRFVDGYHAYPPYIEALRESVAEHWQAHGRGDHLLMSFHGIPQARVAAGDPYAREAHETARLLAQALALPAGSWSVSFQSRFGAARWTSPDTQEVLRAFPARGIRAVSVVCPGFAVDCLETLEEINIENRAAFLAAGGTRFEYIPCLNARAAHARAHADGIELEVRGALPLEELRG